MISSNQKKIGENPSGSLKITPSQEANTVFVAKKIPHDYYMDGTRQMPL